MSASPRESFWTGGGLHRFRNYDHRYDTGKLSIREAFRSSVNLPFVRLMRDIVANRIYGAEREPGSVLDDPEDPRRRVYLERFADWEGRQYLDRFLAKAAGGESRPNRAGAGHPLERWLTRYRVEHPSAQREEVMRASARVRLDAYQWLFDTKSHGAQNRRIWTILERDAFRRIHRDQVRLGYPFARLVPSLATAIGASSDRPSALAELMGIVLSGGVRFNTMRIDGLRFAADTPYEALVHRDQAQGVRVLRQEIAEAVRAALFEVVALGTARRANHALDGNEREAVVRIGGKTGTGDNRYKVFARDGSLVSSRITSRTATFTFLIEGGFFGVVTAHVMGEAAQYYAFTSSLAVQAFRLLSPALAPLVSPAPAQAAQRLPHPQGKPVRR